jgi:hypothetical protein
VNFNLFFIRKKIKKLKFLIFLYDFDVLILKKKKLKVLHKKYQKMLRSKSARSFWKIYLGALGLTTTLGPRVIFIILIIILNLHNSSLSGYGYNIRSKSFGCESDYKVMS